MNYKKQLRRHCRTIRKYAAANSDCEELYDSLIRETRVLQQKKDRFALFAKSGSFSALLQKIAALAPGGEMPVFADFLQKWQDGLTAEETEHLRLCILFYLLQASAGGCRQGTKEPLARAVISCYTIKDYDFEEIAEKFCRTEQILASEKAGVYPLMDSDTRRLYRNVCGAEARKLGVSTEEYAARILMQADEKGIHCGFLLPLKKDRSREGKALLLLCPLIAALLCAAAGIFSGSAAAALLLFFPVWHLLVLMMHRTAETRTAPSPILRMDLSRCQQIPKTVITVSAMIPDQKDIDTLREHLRQLYLSNRESCSGVCLLADLPPAKQQNMPEDKKNLKNAGLLIRRLNDELGNHFALAVRPRSFSQTQRGYIGQNRKRGAILALTEYIRTGRSAFTAKEENLQLLQNTELLLLLDADTTLPFDGLTAMTAAAVHPLNKPVWDAKTRQVTAGYGILAPRAVPSLKSYCATGFSRDFCQRGGFGAYNGKGNDFYADYFGDGIFCGKGLVWANLLYDSLSGRFAGETMLSHDIAEGLILRVLSLTDCCVTDDFPGSENAYFKRQNRWIRGDIQNLPLLKSKTLFFGQKTANPFSFQQRYKLFDNIRRAAAPVFAALGIVLSPLFSVPVGTALCIVCLLSVCGGDLLAGFGALRWGGIRAVSGLYKEDALPDALSCFLRAFLSACQTVTEAVFSLDGIVRGLWRLCVSKRNLLEWTTAAAQDKKGGFAAVLIPRLPGIAAGLFLFFFGSPFAVFCAVLFLMDPLYAYFSQKPLPDKTPGIPEKDREKIRKDMEEMWQYFADHFQKEYHYLPPDNISVLPVGDVAKRTSPTNIGLALCACLAARDMGKIDTAALFDMLDKTVSSVESLKKWHGNLLNWYSITSAQPLTPAYASFVDSGNFICCITALGEGLREYAPEEPRLESLILRLQKLREECDLAAFYNPARKLFAIGFDLSTETFSPSCYDLLMSEARMASYIAVADHRVPAEHWSALSRSAAKCGRYAGCLSWSGTMFEYFMPYLFLPCVKNTLADESLWFCLKSQMRYAEREKMPWGISESCFYAFHENMQYHYKAHGVPMAAMKRFDGKDRVIAPYSTYLALPFAPEESLKNLKKLEKYPLRGQYGMYEALDMDPARTVSGSAAVVQSFMVHHLGMSLLACENALSDKIWQKRFMRDRSACSAVSLLHEKIPQDSAFLSPPEKLPAAKEREKNRPKAEKFLPAAMYSSDFLHMAVHRDGCLALSDGVHSLLRQSASRIALPFGVFAAVRSDGETVSFTPKPSGDERTEYAYRFGKNAVQYSGKNKSLRLTQTVSLCRQEAGVLVRFTVRNLTTKPYSGTLAVYLEPSLSREREERAHRAYSKLFIKSRYNKENGCVVFFRTTESDSCCLAAGFGDAPFRFTTRRDAVLPRTGGIRSLFQRKTETDNQTGDTDCCFYGETGFQLGKGKEISFSFLLSQGDTADQAVKTFARIKAGGGRTGGERVFDDLSQRKALCSHFLSETVFSPGFPRPEKSLPAVNSGVSLLWQVGISGDYPLAVYELAAKDPEPVRDPAAVCSAMQLCGFPVEMVILYQNREGYSDETGERLRRLTADLPSSSHIRILNKDTVPQQVLALLQTKADITFPIRQRKEKPLFSLLSAAPYDPEGRKNGDTEQGFFISAHPPVPWCRTLANRSFGCLVSDRSLGFTWALNSAENKITPWNGDPSSDSAGEILSLLAGGKHYDIIAGATAMLGAGRAEWKSYAAGIVFTAALSVPEKGMRKTVTVTLQNTLKEPVSCGMAYTLTPLLGRDLSYGKTLVSHTFSGGVLFENPYNSDFGGCAFLYAPGSVLMPSFLFAKNAEYPSGATAIYKVTLPPEGAKTVRFSLAFAMKSKAAAALARLPLPRQKNDFPDIQSPYDSLNRLGNRYLAQQTRRTRIYARCGFYQCGGAYGFRDQLQDCLNMLRLDASLLKRQLLRSAASQFPQGDVLHWWHQLLPEGRPKKRGVRTRCSDDMLWLAYGTAEYVQLTGDCKILGTPIPFVTGEELKPGEKDRFFEPGISENRKSLYEHCLLAIERAMQTGEHGLLLMGGGDWNDSFNTVGAEGKGESVWLTEFYILTLKRFLPLCFLMQDVESAEEFRQQIDRLTEAIDAHCWDQDHYIRAFFDDGTPMGSSQSDCCQIDLLPQSFAALAQLPDAERIRTALLTAYDRLYDKQHRIIRLFTPPFDEQTKKAGYVNFYPPGVRENGGQYTHSAVWFAKALFQAGLREQAEEILQSLNPLSRIQPDGLTGQYRSEPYALCGDVYALPGFEGRGGWSLYTGAAGWLLSLLMEEYTGRPPEKSQTDSRTDSPANSEPESKPKDAGGTDK